MTLQSVQKRLRDVLESRQMTQYDFARKHDLSYSWVNKLCNGHVTNPEMKSLDRLVDALDAETGAS